MEGKRIGFVLCSQVSQPLASTRIVVLNMLPFLAEAGYRSVILFESPTASETPDLAGVFERAIESGCDIVVFQKIRGPQAVALARKLGGAGIRTVFSVCDVVDAQMVAVTDATIAISDYLKSLYPIGLHSRIHVVHDGIESPSVCKSDWSSGQGTLTRPLMSVLVTSLELDHLPIIEQSFTWMKVRIVGRYQKGLGRWRQIYWSWAKQPPGEKRNYVRFVMDRRIDCVPWGMESVYREIGKADIGILPITVPSTEPGSRPPLESNWALKSENRLTLKMSAGLPVVATPIPSYEAVIEQGVNGYLARSPRDWSLFLNKLRDPDLRREIGMAARVSVAQKYSMQEQARKFIQVLTAVCEEVSG